MSIEITDDEKNHYVFKADKVMDVKTEGFKRTIYKGLSLKKGTNKCEYSNYTKVSRIRWEMTVKVGIDLNESNSYIKGNIFKFAGASTSRQITKSLTFYMYPSEVYPHSMKEKTMTNTIRVSMIKALKDKENRIMSLFR